LAAASILAEKLLPVPVNELGELTTRQKVMVRKNVFYVLTKFGSNSFENDFEGQKSETDNPPHQ